MMKNLIKKYLILLVVILGIICSNIISVSANELEAVDVDIRNLLTSIALANNLNIVTNEIKFYFLIDDETGYIL